MLNNDVIKEMEYKMEEINMVRVKEILTAAIQSDIPVKKVPFMAMLRSKRYSTRAIVGRIEAVREYVLDSSLFKMAISILPVKLKKEIAAITMNESMYHVDELLAYLTNPGISNAEVLSDDIKKLGMLLAIGKLTAEPVEFEAVDTYGLADMLNTFGAKDKRGKFLVSGKMPKVHVDFSEFTDTVTEIMQILKNSTPKYEHTEESMYDLYYRRPVNTVMASLPEDMRIFIVETVRRMCYENTVKGKVLNTSIIYAKLKMSSEHIGVMKVFTEHVRHAIDSIDTLYDFMQVKYTRQFYHCIISDAVMVIALNEILGYIDDRHSATFSDRYGASYLHNAYQSTEVTRLLASNFSSYLKDGDFVEYIDEAVYSVLSHIEALFKEL